MHAGKAVERMFTERRTGARGGQAGARRFADIAKVKIKTKIKDVAELFYKYDFTVVPVIDKLGKIQGLITMKDAFESVFHQIRKETEQK